MQAKQTIANNNIPRTMHYVVHDEPMYSFGIGATKGEALAEYKRIVATDYLWMKQQEAFLSPALQVEWTYIKQFVCRY